MNAKSLGLALVLVGGALAAGVFQLLPEASAVIRGRTQNDAFLELFRFAVTVMVAGGGALVFGAIRDQQAARKEADKEREAARDEAALRERDRRHHAAQRIEDFFRSLAASYKSIKHVRRLLRHHIRERDGDLEIDYCVYRVAMEDLNQMQLKLEYDKRLATLRPAGLEHISEAAIDGIGGAERFLRRVLREYEFTDPPRNRDTGTLTFGPKSLLARFVERQPAKAEDTAVQRQFFQNLDTIYDEIVARLDELGEPVRGLPASPPGQQGP